MGSCSSSSSSSSSVQKANRRAERGRSQQLDDRLQQDYNRECEVEQCLLLGPPASGKSTLIKQLLCHYGHGYPDEIRTDFKGIIFNNVITSMKILCRQLDVTELKGGGRGRGGGGGGEEENDRRTSPPAESAAAAAAWHWFRHKAKGHEIVSPEIGEMVACLWNTPAIRDLVQQRLAVNNNSKLMENAAYFFSRIRDISAPEYIPSVQDVMCSRVRTAGGLTQVEFKMQKDDEKEEGGPRILRVIDVGGQRNERKKWIHCFEDVRCVLFIVSLADFCRTIVGPDGAPCNALAASFDFWGEIASSRWFQGTDLILLLNKSDAFLEGIQKVDFESVFPDAQGVGTYEECLEWIRIQFEQRLNNNQKMRVHIIKAIDCDGMIHVLHAMQSELKDTASSDSQL